MRKKIRYIVRALLTFVIGMTILIVGYESYLMLNSDKTYIYVVQQQIATQQIAKDAVIVEYMSGNNKALALSELQSTLNTFETNENFIMNSQNSDNVIPLLKTSVVDYQAIDVAVRNIDNSAKVDPVQIQIILDHQRPYFTTLSTVANTIIVNETNKVYIIFFTIVVGKTIILITCLFLWFVLEKFVPTNVDKILGMSSDDTQTHKGGLS
jgi:hypothetical protein